MMLMKWILVLWIQKIVDCQLEDNIDTYRSIQQFGTEDVDDMKIQLPDIKHMDDYNPDSYIRPINDTQEKMLAQHAIDLV